MLLRRRSAGAVSHARDHLADGVCVFGTVDAADLGTEFDDARLVPVAVIAEDGKDRRPGPRRMLEFLGGSDRERLHHHEAVRVFRIA